jgi:glucose-1-phosphate adenylyltransferase
LSLGVEPIKETTVSALAIILADIQRHRLSFLSQHRAEPAVPFGGKYRIIDFVLSNCANSRICDIGILTQYHPHSLNDHIGTGRPWDLDRMWSGGVTLLPPYQRSDGARNWYAGTADAVYQNLDFVQEHQADTVLLLPGEHVYRMDYNPLLDYHRELGADVTVCVLHAPQASGFKGDYMAFDGTGRVIGIYDTPLVSPYPFVSMGIYVFRTEALTQRLNQDARSFFSAHDLAQDVLSRMLELGDHIYAYPFKGYWANVDSVQAYWEANMALLAADPPLKLYDIDWRIYTRGEERPPVTVSTGASISNSIISDGCAIQGQVSNSVLSPGVRIRRGAVVQDSIVLSDCDIGSEALVERAILDKNVVLGEGAYVGHHADALSNRDRVDETDPAIMLVGRDTRLPPGFRGDADSTPYSERPQDVVSIDMAVSPQRHRLRHPQAVAEFVHAA